LAACGATFLAAHAGLARAGLLAWAANRGLESYVWTVNDRRAMRSLLTDNRVAAVITDRPAVALLIRSELQR
jgi:glycerophosphoryl diester phosphodiesterase